MSGSPDIDAAWRAVAVAWATRATGLPIEWVRDYTGPIDVNAFVLQFPIPEDVRDHKRSFDDLQAAFELQFRAGLFARDKT